MRFAISVITPLIIGTNDEIQEFDIFEKDGKAFIVDVVKTSMKLSEGEAREWVNLTSNFVAGKGNVSHGSYGRDFQKTSTKDEVQAFLLRLYGANKLELFDPAIKVINGEYGNYGPIKPTIHFESLSGARKRFMPYIPGSSVKGAIRKAILYRMIKNGVSMVTQGGQRKAIDLLMDNPGSSSGSVSDSGIFSQDPRNAVITDVMKYLAVSDFLPADDVILGLFNVSGKVRSSNVKTSYLGILSGTFLGTMGVNASLIPIIKGPVKDDQVERLRKVLGLKSDGSAIIKDVIALEESMTKWIIESVDIFSRDNGEPTGYRFDQDSRFIVLGQGKGAPLTTVINASPEIIPRAERIGIKSWGRSGTKSLSAPRTRSEVEMPDRKVRPGLCTIQVMK